MQKMITSREIGVRIKKRRIELGISQEKLADQLGVTYQQVQRYENGNNRLNVENIQLIAGILSVPVSQFFATDEVLMVAEERPAYLPADENKLLNYYRKIENSSFKDLVMQVARLAVKAKA